MTSAPAPVAGIRSSVSLLRRNRDFRALFFASVISLGGDWFLWVAINGLIFEATKRPVRGPRDPRAGVGVLPRVADRRSLADRLDRRKLMIVCDVVRAVVCVAFLLVGPDTARLRPAARAGDLRGAVRPRLDGGHAEPRRSEDLPAANALNGSLWGTMLAVGAGSAA